MHNLEEVEGQRIEGKKIKGRRVSKKLADTPHPRRVPETVAEFDAVGAKIPKWAQSIYMLLEDKRRPFAHITTVEQLDQIEETKNLPYREKDILVKYWPHWEEAKNRATSIALAREEEAKRLLKPHRAANAIELTDGFKQMPIDEQLKYTSRIYDQQLTRAALVLAQTTMEDMSADKLSLSIYRARVEYIKDFAWIRDKIWDLGDKIKKAGLAEIQDIEVVEEAKELLNDADSYLRNRKPRVGQPPKQQAEDIAVKEERDPGIQTAEEFLREGGLR